jgi:hypothetical protein
MLEAIAGRVRSAFAVHREFELALQLLFLRASESIGNHDSEIVDASSVD